MSRSLEQMRPPLPRSVPARIARVWLPVCKAPRYRECQWRQPGPENGGRRLRLAVLPHSVAGKEGPEVRLDLINQKPRSLTRGAFRTLNSRSFGSLPAKV